MLEVLRDETVEAGRRDEMAKAAAPYIHPRLSTIEAALTVEDRNSSAQLYEVLSRMSPGERAQVKASFELLRQRLLALPVIDAN
jgi:hypothetical protein